MPCRWSPAGRRRGRAGHGRLPAGGERGRRGRAALRTAHRCRSGEAAGRGPGAAGAALAEAVALWGDRPGAEPALIAAVAPTVATRLAQVSIEAVADLADAELSLGRAEAAAARLAGLLAEHPVHERAAALPGLRGATGAARVGIRST
ncbi:BTAD domain-containing putative transcriptional regulator [Nonomuraea angiospora]|uniref:BTAD domain-containing putative transcriptional regulator n=1 Tax=Nonomuraea angiospora TaxID=46172 RepID=UPI0029BD3C90|nr:BTAD domain-containing putative transcriptional regulator [Nonomuraea angiospora]MDX3105577.1 BTAD domain-containing putative transcriptional regulator [Nonomuraea angiospora]